LGGLIDEGDEREKWIDVKLATWLDYIQQLARVAGTYPQSAYVGMHNSVQVEWTFVQGVVREIGDNFSVIRDVTRQLFISPLLKATLLDDDPLIKLAWITAKNACLALMDPVESADAKF
jgi:hypothetical protein